MKHLLMHIVNLFSCNHRRIYEQLQWQRYLLRSGIPAKVTVLDLVQEKTQIKEYVLIHIWIMLKVGGTISYPYVQTLTNKKDIPSIGEIINIRYCNDDISKVIIV